MRKEKTILRRYQKLASSKYATCYITEIHMLGWALGLNNGTQRAWQDIRSILRQCDNEPNLNKLEMLSCLKS